MDIAECGQLIPIALPAELSATHTTAIAFHENQRGEITLNDIVNLTCGGGKPGQGYPAIMTGEPDMILRVRKLTPVECCRLQAFPDDWLSGLNLSDSAKYRMLGNAVTVSVAEWIAKRMSK